MVRVWMDIYRIVVAVASLSLCGGLLAGTPLHMVTWETLPQFAESNVAIVKAPIRGIVVNHVWLGYTRFTENAVQARSDLAEKGIVYVSPYVGPWSWMNAASVRLVDAVVDVVRRHYALDERVKIVSTGASMGGLSAIMWPVFSRHRVAAVVANCPVTDLEKHYTERPDLPRTLTWAFAGEPDFDAALRAHSPMCQVARMPKIPYFIAHSTKDDAVDKALHSDRFVAAMRQAGHAIEYVASEGTGHAKLSPAAAARFSAALLQPFEDARMELERETGAESVRRHVRENPVVNAAPILYVMRPQYPKDHHNTATIFQRGELNENSYRSMHGVLKILDPKTGRAKVLLDPGPNGMVRDPEIGYDGRAVVFSMRRDFDDAYHIYTARFDGLDRGFDALALADVRQLTFAPDASDIDPVFLPEGDIVFSSTREPKYCMCNRHIMCNLYRMEADGANIRQIGKSTLFEGHATVLPDGRLLYDRWEYVDRNYGDAQGLWVCNPDGTGHAIYWGNNTTSPGGVIDARHLSDGTLIATLCACHDRPRGALALIDRRLGIDGREPVLRTWPASFRDRIHTDREDFDSSRGLARKYEDPYPLDDAHFLCSHCPPFGYGRGMDAIYLLDHEGHEVLVHAEPDSGCYDPMPIRPRAKPHMMPTRRTFEDPRAPGYFYLQNVYTGTHMKGVTNGTVKSLRIVESPEKRTWINKGWEGQGAQLAGMNWHSFENKRILGTVPVEADGSAYFEVPGNTFVYFQALDKDGMMVQSMRSGAYVQPGETYGCVGCHESRTDDTPPSHALRPKAMTRRPSKLNGWHGAPRNFSFQREIQPIFTAKCTACHTYPTFARARGEQAMRASACANLEGDRDLVFCQSYVECWAKGLVRCVGAGPAEIRSAYSWGSHPSRLTRKLRSGAHANLLTAEELDKIITWVDVNAPYYPCYECAYPTNTAGRSPLTEAEEQRLAALAGATIECRCKKRPLAWVSFERPEESRILQQIRTERPADFKTCVAILAEGMKRLRAVPRADMEGFTPCAKDLEREARYQRRLAEERAFYQAIQTGSRRYDALPPSAAPSGQTGAACGHAEEVQAWERGGREKALIWFAENQFGKTPLGRPADEVIDARSVSFAGGRIRINITVALPKDASKAHPVPVFLFGDHSCEERPPYANLVYAGIPTNAITARGYAYVTWNFNDVCPNASRRTEDLDRWADGVIAWQATGDPKARNVPRRGTSWGTIGAWAWGHSRVMDWIETRPELDASRVVVIGHSRGGKTALWAAAQDQRFAMAVSNDSGCGGAKLNGLDLPKSEHIGQILYKFPNWFCTNYASWIGHDAEIPVDSDSLLKLIAPRPVYVASALDDHWAGPPAEFEAARRASSLWRAYGRKGLDFAVFPGAEALDHSGCVGYHLRPGQHDLLPYDWVRYMDFADRHLSRH